MNLRRMMNCTRLLFTASLCLLLLPHASAALKKWAVITSADSKMQDVSLAEITKLCKGTQKTWPDGKNFTLVMRDPDLPEMRATVETLFGVAPSEMKNVIAKMNQSRTVIKIVDTDEDLMRTVSSTPGAIGLIDVYAINSSVKVLRVDGKLPFDVGYALKG
jgi:ABC-type phosphate transport system substrate-binding protein